jgi:hypothetical protein
VRRAEFPIRLKIVDYGRIAALKDFRVFPGKAVGVDADVAALA